MTDDTTAVERLESIEPGTVVYGEEGDVLGVVGGFTDDGIEVIPPVDGKHERAGAGGDAGRSTHEDHPGQAFGEGHLMWRCDECGEMGDLEGGMPDECTNCGASKTALYRARED